MTRESQINWERRRALPYGVWNLKDGSQVLFNRSYKPILGRSKKGVVFSVDPDSWIHWSSQQWFYNDGTTAKAAMAVAIKAFQTFVERGDLTPLILPQYRDVKPQPPALPFPAFRGASESEDDPDWHSDT